MMFLDVRPQAVDLMGQIFDTELGDHVGKGGETSLASQQYISLECCSFHLLYYLSYPHYSSTTIIYLYHTIYFFAACPSSSVQMLRVMSSSMGCVLMPLDSVFPHLEPLGEIPRGRNR